MRNIAPSPEVDLSPPDVARLVDYIAELEREVANARRYLNDCRQVVQAEEGEMLLDALRRCVRTAEGRAGRGHR